MNVAIDRSVHGATWHQQCCELLARSLAYVGEIVHNPRAMAIEDKPLVRGEPIVAKVLEATVAEIAHSGYAALTLERVAARAGVNRTTIFRRWPTKKDLVRATMNRMTEQVRFDWDHGSLRADLAEFIAVAARTVFAPGMLGMQKMMVEARSEPELGELARCIRDEKHDAAFALLTRAEKRREFRKDLVKELFPTA
jgi:AcrR family transcriptional regulator